MKFITYSEKQLIDPNYYLGLQEDHLLISIKDPQKIIILPNIPSCKERLDLEFINDQGITMDGFSSAIARDILTFVDNHCKEANVIACHCEAGLCRSVAVASALSKIINNKDDEVFQKGVPNMFIYSTILDTFYGTDYQNIWPSITYLKEIALKRSLDPSAFRYWYYTIHD